ncbi:hypothetical protein LSTR_LSTR006728 [Laodelphax striatellus]|uniref:Uncharacterized protein n=1 Tax=Laodelphax striatellus TaxID=195883 RepID=A0A482XVA2_LAOST|nr:hypothetical protein LSTR_LSTR006728 [Laodelphax striatellus]
MKVLCMALIFLVSLLFGLVRLQNPCPERGKRDLRADNSAALEATCVPQYFDQKLDHFDKSNNKTWKQRYYIYSELYDTYKFYPSIPLFLILGGEMAVNYGTATNNSPMFSIGKDYKALMVVLEHRYYGESKPTPNITTENLKYLSSRQAVEDIAYFVDEIKKKYGMKCNNEVVLFGGSYAGALAAWTRLKHPDKINVVQASSAPVANIYNFRGFNNVVRSSIKLYDDKCASVIYEGAMKQQELAQTEEGQKNLTEKFQACRTLTDKNNRRAFFQTQIGQIGHQVQYNGTKNDSIPHTCSLLTAGGDEISSVDKLANYLIETSSDNCTGYDYSADIKYLQHTDYISKDPFRQFLYMDCNEFGLSITSDTNDSFYADTLGVDFYDDRCKDVFGDKYTSEYIKSQVEKTNAYYGKFNYRQGKVLFTNGQLDPYQAASILESNDKIGYKALVIENVGHTRDLDVESEMDPPALKEARVQIKKIIKGWIKALDFSKPIYGGIPTTCKQAEQYYQQYQQQQAQKPSASPTNSNPFSAVYSYLNMFNS